MNCETRVRLSCSNVLYCTCQVMYCTCQDGYCNALRITTTLTTTATTAAATAIITSVPLNLQVLLLFSDFHFDEFVCFFLDTVLVCFFSSFRLSILFCVFLLLLLFSSVYCFVCDVSKHFTASNSSHFCYFRLILLVIFPLSTQ